MPFSPRAKAIHIAIEVVQKIVDLITGHTAMKHMHRQTPTSHPGLGGAEVGLRRQHREAKTALLNKAPIATTPDPRPDRWRPAGGRTDATTDAQEPVAYANDARASHQN